MLGCGNAKLSEEMYDAGYRNIYNIDISPVVIEQMADRNHHREKMLYYVMDVRDLSKFEDRMFDAAIDKSTIDALLCGDDAFLNVARMTKEVQRVLKHEGIYMVISYGRPESRLPHFERAHLDFQVRQLMVYPKDETNQMRKLDRSHYVYLCTKGKRAVKNCELNWETVEKQLKEDAIREQNKELKGKNIDKASKEEEEEEKEPQPQEK